MKRQYTKWDKETRTLERVRGENEEVILKRLTGNIQLENWNEVGVNKSFSLSLCID